MHPDEENRPGDQTRAVSHFQCTDHPSDQPAAAVADHTSPEAKGQSGTRISRYAAEAARQGRTHGLGVEWDYPEEPDDLPNPLIEKMRRGGLLPPKPQPRRPALPVNVVGAGRARSYALHGLSKELRILAYTTEGSRNDQLNRTAFKVARFVRDGLLSYDEVIGPLRDTAAAIGLSDREIEATIRSAFSGADAKDLHTEIPDNTNDLPSAYQIGGDEQ
ncbi:hypothetical protein MHPYR_240057 [uncultured Mycobacterium sp.]|uniref:Uncharacterized protein n=1 Tax=uncultured Mycobacterium sp. TaxID=171292 RepID=A0A1Y5PAC7_9MYCO|nr:hypothetical protein MHPYR_240057 [uncultured Mycobacterium sp.]